MSSFDIVVYFALIVAVIFGFRVGLLRSLAVIVGYLLAMPIAVWAMSLFSPQFDDKLGPPWLQDSLPFFVIFFGSGIVLGKMLQAAISEMVGSEIGPLDRIAGAALGAARVGLVAVTLVLVFEQIVPPNLQPSFLTESQLRPILSRMGQQGFKALPSDVTTTINQWKRERGIQ